MMNLFSLEGKISFVTGAGSGIGQRLAVGRQKPAHPSDASTSANILATSSRPCPRSSLTENIPTADLQYLVRE
jgi:hypothetical protein